MQLQPGRRHELKGKFITLNHAFAIFCNSGLIYYCKNGFVVKEMLLLSLFDPLNPPKKWCMNIDVLLKGELLFHIELFLASVQVVVTAHSFI